MDIVALAIVAVVILSFLAVSLLLYIARQDNKGRKDLQQHRRDMRKPPSRTDIEGQ